MTDRSILKQMILTYLDHLRSEITATYEFTFSSYGAFCMSVRRGEHLYLVTVHKRSDSLYWKCSLHGRTLRLSKIDGLDSLLPILLSIKEQEEI